MGTRGSVPAPERKEVAEKKKVAKRKRSSAPSCSRARKKADRDAREAENAQRLDKLPQEVWGKILDQLDDNDLFPLALSCRYFRQKQKELVARTRQNGPMRGKHGLNLKTSLGWNLRRSQPASADYLRFCSQEKVPKKLKRMRDKVIRCLAAFHGCLPLLKELQAGPEMHYKNIAQSAGESSFPRSLLLLLLSFGF